LLRGMLQTFPTSIRRYYHAFRRSLSTPPRTRGLFGPDRVGRDGDFLLLPADHRRTDLCNPGSAGGHGPGRRGPLLPVGPRTGPRSTAQGRSPAATPAVKTTRGRP